MRVGDMNREAILDAAKECVTYSALDMLDAETAGWAVTLAEFNLRSARSGDFSHVDDSFIVYNLGRWRGYIVGFTLDENLGAEARHAVHLSNLEQNIFTDNPDLTPDHNDPLSRLIVPACGSGVQDGWPSLYATWTKAHG